MEGSRTTILRASKQTGKSRVLPRIMFVVIILLLSASTALADTMQFPADLDEIGTEAFYADSSLDNVILPEGIRIIGDRAFANSSATQIYLPNSVISIGLDAFANCDSLTCIGIPGSYAEEYCTANNVPFSPIVTDPSCFEYEATSGVKAKITKYNGTDSIVVIPDTIDGYKITAINSSVFSNNSSITMIVLPAHLEAIANSQFYECNGLTDVIVKDNVRSIGSNAFRNCYSLEMVEFVGEQKLESISYQAFMDCQALRQIELPDSVYSIGPATFKNCKSLEEFHYPTGWTSVQLVGGLAAGEIFYGCEKLLTIDIPEGVTSIPEYAFANCNYLQNVYLPNGLITIGSSAFSNTASMQGIIFPSSLKNINWYAFKDCQWLENLDGLSTTALQKVGYHAFEGCTNLQSASLPDSVTVIGPAAFIDCESLVSFHYPVSWSSVESVTDGSAAGRIFANCKKLLTIDIPEGVTAIPDNAFANCTYLRQVNLPEGLLTIGSSAFWNTESMQGIVFPSSLKVINWHAFRDCEWLENLDGLSTTALEKIGYHAFDGCINLQSANLPDTVTVIGPAAFINCESLVSFHYPISWSSLENVTDGSGVGRVFANCKKLLTIDIPDGVTSIPANAFANCNYLQYVNIPNSVTTIGYNAFYQDTALAEVYLSEYISSIGNNAFKNCGNLTAYCEWGTYALSYLQNNNVNYFYLSLTNSYRLIHDSTVNSTMYKGDIYSLYGYVRSSVPVSQINITVKNTQNSVVINETVYPDETDVLLNNAFSGLVCFETLELGTYHLTMDATAGDVTERLSNSMFTVVPPPLRIGVSDLNVPQGITDPNFTISGTISANYTINQINVTIWNEYETTAIAQKAVSPNANTYDLGNISSYFNFASLSFGSYVFTVDIYTENGNCEDYIHNVIIPVENATSYSEEQLNAILTFALDDDNRTIFDSAAGYANDYFYNVFDQVDTFELGPIKLSFSTDAFIIAFNDYRDIAWGQINEKLYGRDTYLIDLYKGQIMAVIKEISGREVSTTIDKNNFVLQVMDWIASSGDAALKIDQLGIVDSEILKAGASIIKPFEDLFKAVKQANPSVTLANDLNRGIAYSLAQNLYEISLIQAVRNSMVVGTDVNSRAFSQAMDEVYSEYAVEGYGVVVPIIKHAIDLAKGESIRNILQLVGEDAGAFYSVANFAIKVYNKISGLNDISNDRKSFIKIFDNACNASQAYKRAYDVINDGDTSMEALNSLYFTYCYARTSWKSMMDFLKTNWLPGSAVYFDAEHTKIKTMKFPGIEQ